MLRHDLAPGGEDTASRRLGVDGEIVEQGKNFPDWITFPAESPLRQSLPADSLQIVLGLLLRFFCGLLGVGVRL
jgi:hypothetical protein